MKIVMVHNNSSCKTNSVYIRSEFMQNTELPAIFDRIGKMSSNLSHRLYVIIAFLCHRCTLVFAKIKIKLDFHLNS